MSGTLLRMQRSVARITREDLFRLGIPMSKITTITEAADKTCAELTKELGGNAASVALAIALGKLCAEGGLDLDHMMAMVELSNRETRAEIDRGNGCAA